MTQTPNPISESTLTDRYQTTIPDPIRKILGLSKRDKICYTIEADNRVVISRADAEASDPILEKFLNFLAGDIENNPQHLQAIAPNMVARAKSLVADVDFDLDLPLDEGNE